MADQSVRNAKLVTVFGGTGFVGRSVVKALADAGWRVRIASRRPDRAFASQTAGTVGQISAVQANLRYPDSVARALVGAQAAVNLVGLLAESGPQTFASLHVGGARAIATAAKAAGVTHFVQMSAIGADPQSTSVYGRTKAEGEQAVRDLIPEAVILRPSVVFGQDDKFFNRFAAMARILPALPLIGGGKSRLQPVFVGDVAAAAALAVDGKATGGTIYELGGPTADTFKDILSFILEVTGRRRFLLPLPFPAAEAMGRATEIAKKLSFGLLPEMMDLTQDQVELLKKDNVVSPEAIAENRTLQALGITPESYQSFVPTYLYRYRKTGQYAAYHPN
jgi:NADH dehydrogenase